MNILIADDDPVTLRLLSSRLGAWGHTVHQAADGNTAWETIRSTPIDMVISDWMMPEMDGLQLCRRIRELHEPGYIYLILISAQNSKADIVRGLESGVDDYVTKPIDMDALHARIEIGARIINLERTLNRKIEIITANHYQTIRMFSRMMEVIDDELGGTAAGPPNWPFSWPVGILKWVTRRFPSSRRPPCSTTSAWSAFPNRF
jgi:putative two-component system response regulator